MPKLQTKIALILFIFLCRNANAQLSLENIFLTNKYAPEQPGLIRFLHTKPLFAMLTGAPTEKNIAFYNNKNEKTAEWNISAYIPKNGNADKQWSDFMMSNTDKYVLLRSDCEQIYRRSFSCNYFLADASGRLEPLSESKQFYPQFSPNDSKIAFVQNNNLFYKDLSAGTEVQVTDDGKWNTVINGKSDWVYEEELELTRAYEWNAQSDKIAYLKFDEIAVKEYSIPMYYDMQYPNLFSYKYPKVGEENSKVSVWIYYVKSKKNKQLEIPYSYEYIPRIYWNAQGDEVIMMLLNRHQDSLRLISYNIKNKNTRVLYLETSNTYVDVPKTVYFLSDQTFIVSSEKDGFNHLYHYNREGILLKQITAGNYEVKQAYGVDEKNKKIYYQSNEGNATETILSSINYETLEKIKLSHERGSNKAIFSTDNSFYFHIYSSATTPPQWSIRNPSDTVKILLEDNRKLLDSLREIPKKEFIKIPIRDYDLNAWIIKPASFDSTRKYPLLMYVYGGPGDQQVLNEWPYTRDLFFNYLASKGIAVACVDNRGTDGRGVAFGKSTFLHLGKLETEDQVLSAKYFGSLPYIDKNRIAIYGWSYGGLISSLCLFEGAGVFKSAIAVAPITSWKLYDNIYTERYMHTVPENPAGYSYNPLHFANKLSGNFLLMHGMADDNVHFQHSIFLINALNDAHKQYQLSIYPDKEHSITGRKSRYDIFLRMEEFLKEKL
jgi:dipeptidyl-peptidase-4